MLSIIRRKRQYPDAVPVRLAQLPSAQARYRIPHSVTSRGARRQIKRPAAESRSGTNESPQAARVLRCVASPRWPSFRPVQYRYRQPFQRSAPVDDLASPLPGLQEPLWRASFVNVTGSSRRRAVATSPQEVFRWLTAYSTDTGRAMLQFVSGKA
ncbi:hypothetical protein KCP73_17520 [Salmonella enterica subsp. enterica]|nr:hypothetical protein KCP73_17520 [Salmonella enterica subsp. enterica]